MPVGERKNPFWWKRIARDAFTAIFAAPRVSSPNLMERLRLITPSAKDAESVPGSAREKPLL
jgi:hypothetical protein